MKLFRSIIKPIPLTVFKFRFTRSIAKEFAGLPDKKKISIDCGSIPSFFYEDHVKKVLNKIMDKATHFGNRQNYELILKDIAIATVELASIKSEQKQSKTSLNQDLFAGKTLGNL